MKTLCELLLWAALSLSPPPPSRAFSKGASSSSCSDMRPGHIRAQLQDPQHSHIMLHAEARSYLPGDPVVVTVTSTRDFMGFLLQARTVRDGRVAGSFVQAPPGSRLLSCTQQDDTATHSDKLLKRNLSFIWRAPDRPLGDVKFLITAVQSYFVYWAGIESAKVRDETEATWEKGRSTSATTQVDNDWTSSDPRFQEPTPVSKVQALEELSRLEEGGLVNTPEGEKQWENSSQYPMVPSAPALSSSPLTLPPDPGQAWKNRESPAPDLQACQDCDHEPEGFTPTESLFQQSTGWPDPQKFTLLTFSTEAPVTEPQSPEQPPRSATIPGTTHTDPEGTTTTTQDASSSPHLEPSPAPRRSHLDTATQAAPMVPLQQTVEGGSRGQKAVVGRNVSRGGGGAGPPQEGAGPPGKGERAPGKVPQLSAAELGMLLGCATGLGMALVAGARYLHGQFCLKRTEVSLSDRHPGIIQVQECGDLVQVRKIRQNSFVLLQAEYNVMSPLGN